VPDLNGFVEGIRILLKEKGVAVVEVPYVKDMIEACAFDTIYHEHLCYFSLTALAELFERHALVIEDLESIPSQGGSLRLFIRHKGGYGVGARVTNVLAEEANWGVKRFAVYKQFGARARSVKKSLLTCLRDLRRRHHRIAAYGAAAKGSVLLNYCGVGSETLEYVVDRSPYKQGKYMPGVHLPIGPTDWLTTRFPDYLLILAWNVAEEIVAQQAPYQARGGRFIIPIPVLEIR
jgi:hypothetical protein